jgi:uncharacterized protein with HEPN domain
VIDQRLAEYLDQMIESAGLAAAYVDGMDAAGFGADRRTQQAVLLNLLALGEAATRVLQDHAEFADRHPEVQWRSLKGIRNRIARGLFDLDHETVWRTLQDATLPGAGDLARLREALAQA